MQAIKTRANAGLSTKARKIGNPGFAGTQASQELDNSGGKPSRKWAGQKARPVGEPLSATGSCSPALLCGTVPQKQQIGGQNQAPTHENSPGEGFIGVQGGFPHQQLRQEKGPANGGQRLETIDEACLNRVQYGLIPVHGQKGKRRPSQGQRQGEQRRPGGGMDGRKVFQSVGDAGQRQNQSEPTLGVAPRTGCTFRSGTKPRGAPANWGA